MTNYIKFLGTAGARVVVAKQLRASGGIWLSLDQTNILIDPGPGSLVHTLRARPKLDPTILDGIVLTHKHLDHSADINVMMEAMTVGGKEKRGIILVPADAVSGDDPVIYKYIRKFVAEIRTMKVGGEYQLGNLLIKTPVAHHHGVETFGLIIKGKKQKIAYIADTRYFSDLPRYYNCDTLILSVLSTVKTPFDHLNVEEAEEIIKKLRPQTTILTHFGIWMLKAKPELVAKSLSAKLGLKVRAARDGMSFAI